MVSQQIGLETSGLGFGRLCECLGGIIFTFVTFSHERHFHLSSGISLSLSLSPFLCLVLHSSTCPSLFLPLLQQIFPLKPIPGLLQKCSAKHEFYIPYTQSSVNTLSDHCGCSHPITDIHFLTGLGTHEPAQSVFTSSGAEIKR